jgi:alpha-ketoglutarate-dependent taurine dioxygenase
MRWRHNNATMHQSLIANPGATIRQLAPTFGAEIVGLDLSKELNHEAFEEIREAATKV